MKKIEHIWSIVCSNSTTDQQTNNISLFNLVEKFSVVINKKDNPKVKKNQKIIIPFGQEVVSRFRKKIVGVDIAFEMKMDIIDPAGKLIKGTEIKTISFPKKFTNIRIKNKIDNIPVEKSGLYYFSVKIRDVGETKFEEVGLVPVDINIEIKE